MATKQVVIRDGWLTDVAQIAQDARQADVDELWAYARVTPDKAMVVGLTHGTHTWTAAVDGVPVCMFGVVPVSLLGGVGAPWMVGTNELLKNQVPLIRNSRPYVKKMLTVYSTLFNVVDSRNTLAIRWLRWCGFKVDAEEKPMGPDGVLFRPFYLRSEPCAAQ